MNFMKIVCDKIILIYEAINDANNTDVHFDVLHYVLRTTFNNKIIDYLG